MANDAGRVTTTVRFDLSPARPVEGLSPEGRVEHAAHLMEKELAETRRRDRPRAVLTGGQPGSGKSGIVDEAKAELGSQGGVIALDPDEIRTTLPYMKERIARGDLDIPDAAYEDAGTITYQMLQIAKAERRNVIVDGTLQNTARALGLADELTKAGYDVEFRGMAVHPDLSHARTYSRREDQIARSPSRFGRGVSDEFHDQAVEGYRNTVEAFQKNSAVSSMTLVGSDGRKIETKLVDGQWTPAVSMREQMEAQQRAPDIRAMMAATDAWWEASRLMNARHAPDEEVRKVAAFGQFAALQERQMRATSIRAHIDMPAPTAPDREMDARTVGGAAVTETQPVRHDLSNEDNRALAALVHAGIREAGRDADRSVMTVNWEKDDAYLDVRTPGRRGYERLMLPGHDRIERAIAGLATEGSLEVDYATSPPRVAGLPQKTLEAKAMGLGLDAKDFGIGVQAPALERGQERPEPAIRGGAIAAMMAARGQQR